MEIYHIVETDSTSSEMRRRISDAQVTDPSMLVAEYQTAGRGQGGNRWESEAGKNLLFSVFAQPKALDVREQYYLSMAVSVAVVGVLRTYVPETKVKWPNDIYVGDRKMAGILIENTLRGMMIGQTIVGMGLNVNQTEFSSSLPNPVSLKSLTGVDSDILIIAQQLGEAIQKAITRVDCKDYANILDDYMAILYRNDGNYYPYSDADGDFEARIVCVEPDGHIHLMDRETRERRYTFKEVEFVL